MLKSNSKRGDLIKLSFSEEVSNAISHGLMAFLLLISLPLVTLTSYFKGGWLLTLGTAIFTIALFLMFLASTLYHSMAFDSKHKVIFRVLDHIFIFVAIAGTYTPIALTVLPAPINWLTLTFQWLCVLSGILYKTLAKSYSKKITLALYLVMGWSAIFFFPLIIKQTQLIFQALIVLGGLFYTAGTWFYSQKQRPYFHFIWHLWIDLAALTHWIAIIFFLG